MSHLCRCLLVALSVIAGCLWAADDAALMADLERLASDDATERRVALEALGRSRDPRLIPFLTDYGQGSVYRWQGRIVLGLEVIETELGKATILRDPLSRHPIQSGTVLLAELVAVEAGRRERSLAREALTVLRLFVPDREARLAAVNRLGDGGDLASRPLLQEVLAVEQDPGVRRAAEEGLLLLRVADRDPAQAADRRSAIAAVGAYGSARGLARLHEVLATNPDATTLAITRAAIARSESWQRTVRAVGHVFSGLSLGSILILMALGLAIIFGGPPRPLFKVAVIIQQIYNRYVRGFTKDERFAQFNRQVAALAQEAQRATSEGTF